MAVACWSAASSGWRGIRDRRAVAQCGDPACRAATDLAKLTPRFGEVAASIRPTPVCAFPTSLSDDRGDRKLSVAQLGRAEPGRLVCRAGADAGAALQAKLGSARFDIVAINIDTRDPDKPKTWLKDAGVTTLGYFSDEKARVFQELKAIGRAIGMPTSVLIDTNGCEIGTMSGPAEWASDDGVALIKAALQGEAKS